MTDFAAGRLERIAASAYDLVANAFLGEPSAVGLQGQHQEPVCTEPFCGGWYWKASDSWQPQEAPPTPPMPHEGQGDHPPGDVDAAPPPPKSPAEVIRERLSGTALDKIDLTGAHVYLPLDKPIAKRVKLLRSNPDSWQWYLADKAVQVKDIGVSQDGQVEIVKGERERDEIMDHLDRFLRMDKDVEVISKGVKIPKGSQIVTIKPYEAPIRITPNLGTREQIRKDKFPLSLTFGMPNEGGNPKMGKKTGTKVPVPRQPAEEPVTVPVKRLDVVLRKPRQDLHEFLPPLMSTVEPHIASEEMW
jgi:hypothetical protein